MKALLFPFQNSLNNFLITLLALSTFQQVASQLVYAEDQNDNELFLNNFTLPFQDEIERNHDITAEIERRQASSSVVIYDPSNPPLLTYHCGVLVEICKNIALEFAAKGMDLTNGQVTTMLHYSPARTDNRRSKACGSFNEKCKQFYSCDTRFSNPKRYWRTSCDEFPFASSGEGGKGAHIRCVSPFEQSQQGAAQGLLGAYMAEVVTLASGSVTTMNWAALASGNPSFSRPYTFAMNELFSTGNEVAQLMATVIGQQNSYATFTRNANKPTAVVGTYNYDKYVFTASNRLTTCLCTTGATTSCSTCIPTRRPPFGTNPPDGGDSNLKNKINHSPRSTPKPTPAPKLSPSSDDVEIEVKRKEMLKAIYKRFGSMEIPKNSLHKRNETLIEFEKNANSVAELIGQFKFAQSFSSSSLFSQFMKRQQDSCPKEEETPEEEAEDQANNSQSDSYDAEDQADSLPDSNSQKAKALDAARKAEVAADQAINFLNSFVGPEVVSSAVAAALAAAAALNRNDPAIDPIYSKVTSAANEASSVLSIAKANPTAFPSTCSTKTCSNSNNNDGDGPTFIPPPPPPVSTRSTSTSQTTATTSTTSMQPTGTPGQNGCFIDGESRTWGVRVPEARPTYACYEDLSLTVEPIQNSKRIRLSTVVNGNKGYLSWTPQDIQNCGEVNFIQLIPTSNATALTMEWQVDRCYDDKSAHISPFWNNAPFPNFAIELLNLLPIGSPDENALQCYKNSLSITTYTDQFYTMLAPNAKDNVPICSDKYPQSNQAAAAAAATAHAQVQTNSITRESTSTTMTNDRLLQQASAWPTRLIENH